MHFNKLKLTDFKSFVDGTELEAEKLLVSVGRAPQTEGIGLESAGVPVVTAGVQKLTRTLRRGLAPKTALPKSAHRRREWST